MPTDEYASVAGGGALKLKGGKVQKNKKDKKKKKKSKELTIERSLSTEDNTAIKEVEQTQRDDSKNKTDHSVEGLVEHKTEAERRHEEANRKKVHCRFCSYSKAQQTHRTSANFGLLLR